MKKSIRFLFGAHQLTGCVIALFFLMWFLSGLVLIYHPYPRLSDQQLNRMKEPLPDSLPDLPSIETRAGGKLKALSIRQFQGQTLVSVRTADSSFTYTTDHAETVKPITFDFIQSEARRWFDAPIVRVDTLRERVQWILYSKYDRLMPIYRFYYDDKEAHELFISGKTGEAQQLTDRGQRFWAWLGAIPHKFYLPFIRKDLDLWDTTITIGGAFCLTAALSGLILGIYLCVKTYRQRGGLRNPYRKTAYRWHYALGLIMGIFLVTWGISGLFAMQRVPKWLVPYKGKYVLPASDLWGKGLLPADAYQLDHRALTEAYPALKEIHWTRFGDLPAYEIVEGEETHFIDASSPEEIKELLISEQIVEKAVRRLHGDEVAFNISLINRYDNYYLSYKHAYPLPAYKVVVDDENRSRYYIDPKSGYVRYLNKNKMVKRWVFNAFHYLNLKFLVERPALWTFCIWTLCLGGATVSATGVWLGIKFLRRKLKCQR